MQYTLHLTDACNLACEYCRLAQGPGYMSGATACRAIDLALSGGEKVVGIGFYGGEPLLCKSLIYEIVRYGREKRTTAQKVFFKLTTNGLLLDDAFLDYAKREGILLSLSIDGTRTAHDKNRKASDGQGSFDRLKPIIPKLLARNRYAAAMMTIAPNTAGEVCDGVKAIYSMGFVNIICSLDYGADWTEQDLQKLGGQYQKLAKFYYEQTVRERKFFLNLFDSKMNSHIHRREYGRERCKLGYEQISVSPAGGLYPCVQFVGDERYRIGDVSCGIDEERRKAIYQESRAEYAPCQGCALRERCLHSCACVNKCTTGALHEPSALLCANERLLIPIADRIAAKLYRERNGMFIQKHYNEHYALVSLLDDHTKTK